MVFDLSSHRRRWILLVSAVGFSGYGAYRLYHHPSIAIKRRRLYALAGTLISAAEAAASAADAVSLVSSDLSAFLRSDSDEIPASLKQLAKIVNSEEFSGSLSGVSEAATIGVLRAFGFEQTPNSSGFSDKLLDKLFSTDGSGFVSVVVGTFARNLVVAFYSSGDSGDPTTGWVDLICNDRSRELIADCIQRFVSTAVTVYLDKTMVINTYDELFAGITNPKHESKVKDLLVSLCNRAVETLVTTSHRVLTTSKPSSSASDRDVELSHRSERGLFDHEAKGDGRWVDQVSSTLAVPSNKKFVLDVTGRVTFETVRSFLDFMLWKLYDGARRGVNVVREEVFERGLEVVRFVSAKSMAVIAICFAMCMRVLMSTRFVMSA